MAKTREEVENLKADWSCDPSWNLYETEGFEEYRDELQKYQEDFALFRRLSHETN